MEDPKPVRWPDILPKDHWVVDAIEEQFRSSSRSSDEMRAHAAELRTQAAETDITGVRKACLALAVRWEEAAADRTPAR